VPLLAKFIGALPLMQPTTGNIVFAVVATCLLTLLVIASAWYWVLFAIHARSARLQDGETTIERFFAPTVRIATGYELVQKKMATPSNNAQNYQRGTLFIAGMSSFYVADSHHDLFNLIERHGSKN